MSSPRMYGQTYDLGQSFLKNVGENDLLSAAEEQNYSRQYCEQRGILHKMIWAYPLLIMAQLKRLRENIENIRLRDFFEYEMPTSLEDDDEGGDDNENVRRLEAVTSIVTAYLKDEKNDLGYCDDNGRIIFFNGMKVNFHERFYAVCLEMVRKEEWKPEIVSVEDWKPVVAEMNSCVSRLEQALNKLVEGNQRLVISIARRYRCQSMTLGDMVQEGNLGLIRAVENFDYSMGHRFSTYASYWIRQAIGMAINSQGRPIRLPANMLRQLSKIERCERELLQKNGEMPTSEQIASALGITASRVRAMKKMGQQTISLQSLSTEDRDWNELFPDSSPQRYEEEARDEAMQTSLNTALQLLNEREREILIRRFGLMNHKIETLEQLGVRFGLSCERVRQIEASALEKLRTPGTSRLFEGL